MRVSVATSWIYAPSRECKWFIAFAVREHDTSPTVVNIGDVRLAKHMDRINNDNWGCFVFWYDKLPAGDSFYVVDRRGGIMTSTYDSTNNFNVCRPGFGRFSSGGYFAYCCYGKDLARLQDRAILALRDYSTIQYTNRYDLTWDGELMFNYLQPDSSITYDIAEKYEVRVFATNIPMDLYRPTSVTIARDFHEGSSRYYRFVDDLMETEKLLPQTTIEYEQIRVIPSEEE